ncbi:hypothetical protein Q4E40_02885 [Pontibacter sp. BT731]|uniref:hypothetical protein n=1 Tax=Pontibacter coccineus TaxID=3063328 RepID=UPI0026E313B0|nr:hypothetical protein [Pontibacter sp. BT731]MDO6389059.1 hypothetical protein [Pontibacter sp. BT731]
MFDKEANTTGSYRIKGNSNVQGTGNQVSGSGDCEQQLAIALKEIEGLKREVELYKEMVALLKK